MAVNKIYSYSAADGQPAERRDAIVKLTGNSTAYLLLVAV
jgi:hypothetical protein